MRIIEVNCQPVGPLQRPLLFRPGPCTVIHDENEAGKTTVVDILVNLLFRRTSAQSRFNSRRFKDYRGWVLLELGGKELRCTGGTDLDRLLGLPLEFSRLPIVRGGDLAFLWSQNRERKTPLMDACIRYFSGEERDNLQAAVRNIRAAAGLTQKRNVWSREKRQRLGKWLDLYRDRERLLADLARREEVNRRLAELEGELRLLGKDLAVKEQKIRQLAEERLASLCAAGQQLQAVYSGLRQKLRDGGYERYTREDATKWSRLETRLQELRRNEAELKQLVGAREQELGTLRQELEMLNVRFRLLEKEARSAGADLEGVRSAWEERKRTLAVAVSEIQGISHTVEAARERRRRTRWLLIPAVTALAAAAIFLVRKLYPAGWALAGTGLVALAGYLLTASGCQRAGQEAAARTADILVRCGLEGLPWSEAPGCLQKKMIEEEAACQMEMAKAQERSRQADLLLQQTARQLSGVEQRMQTLREDRERVMQRLRETGDELGLEEQAWQDLLLRTGKGSLEQLEAALEEKEALERELTSVHTRLELLLGGEGSWSTTLPSLQPYLERYPHPQPVEELDRLRAELSGEISDLRERQQKLLCERDSLLKEQAEASRRLLAAGREDLLGLALSLKEAEEGLRQEVRRTLASLWVQQVLEQAREGVEDALTEPLTRAAELFREISGRYREISWDRVDGEVVFSVTGDKGTFGEEVLSDGARSQFLLSLRLALLEQSLGNERGFLVLDDPLLNSSSDRKQRAVEVLLSFVRAGWQIIYLTVEDGLPELFAKLGGGLVQTLRVEELYLSERSGN